MDMCYVPTGRAWNGRRDIRGGVTWQESDTQAEWRPDFMRAAQVV
jgi:hypothetical protein